MNPRYYFNNNKDYISMAIFAIIFLIIIFLPQHKKIDEREIIKAEQTIEKKIPEYELALETVIAKSYYVYDVLENMPIFSKEEHLKLPLASITKMMSGLVALENLPEATIINIGMDDIRMEGDSGLAVGEKWRLKDLLDFSLMTSSNDGMHAITSYLDEYFALQGKDTIKIMNQKAIDLGLLDTVFMNETGLDIDKNMAGAYSSAHDVSLLFSYIIKNNPNLISDTNTQSKTFISESNIKHFAENTNLSMNNISGMLASKTGYTNLAGGNLAIVFDAGFMHPIVVVVLGSTTEGRFDDIIKLSKAALEKLSD